MATDGSTKAVVTAIGANGLITVAKGVGWIFTASPSLLAEAIHSFADTANQILLLVGIKKGERGPSQKHPWGHGQERYLWNLVSAMGIFFLGCGITTWHGLHALLHPPTGEIEAHPHATVIGLGILIFALILEGYTLYVAYVALRQQTPGKSLWAALRAAKDPTTVGVFLEDAIAVTGVVLALLGFWLTSLTGSHLPDAIASLLIGLLLGVMALWLARINGKHLIDLALPESEEAEIRATLAGHEYVEEIVELKTTILSPGRVRLHAEVELHGGLLADREQLERDARSLGEGADPMPLLSAAVDRSVRIVGRRIDEIEAEIQVRHPSVVAIYLEVV